MASIGGVDSRTPKSVGEVTFLPFSFAPNGSSDPVKTTIKGKGVASITYVSASVWKVTLTAPWVSLISWSADLMNAAGGSIGFNVEIDGTSTDVTKGLIYLRSVNASGSAADIPAASTTRVGMILVLSASTLNA